MIFIPFIPVNDSNFRAQMLGAIPSLSSQSERANNAIHCFGIC